MQIFGFFPGDVAANTPINLPSFAPRFVRLLAATYERGRTRRGPSTYAFLPGANAANTNIALPADAPTFLSLTSARLLTVGDFANAASDAPDNLTVVSGAPAAGQIQLVDADTIQLGGATTQYHVLVLTGEAYQAPVDLAVVEQAPVGNQIRLTGAQQVELGIATEVMGLLTLFGVVEGSQVAV